MTKWDPLGKLIQGDNSHVLDSLWEQQAQVTCAYIDPPYNNRDRLRHYHDDLDDGVWLEEIGLIASKIKRLLSSNGSLWVSIDDGMMHYLKVKLDSIFGKENFIATIVWEHRTTRENRATFSNNHEYILLYAASAAEFKLHRNPLPFTEEWAARFSNPDNDPRGAWQSVSATAQAGHATQNQFYEVVSPKGRRQWPPKGRCWIYNKEKMAAAIGDGRVYFGRDGNGVPRIKKYLKDANGGLTPHTLWKADEVGTTATAKKHILGLLKDVSVFDTPKPEPLLARIISIASNPGDLVLDAYLGSGTTASVAHKLGRRYVGIEIGDHIATHCAARLRGVCEGEQGGISKSVGWRGGGTFDIDKLASA